MTALEVRTGTDPSPLAQVLQLCARGATGEVVGVAGNLEVLISLQGGRLAWATSNTERRLFTRVLLETTRLRTEVVDALDEAGSRQRGQLAQALVLQGHASMAQVRTALRVELETVLEVLRRAPQVHTLFVPRTTGSCPVGLTFAPGGLEFDWA